MVGVRKSYLREISIDLVKDTAFIAGRDLRGRFFSGVCDGKRVKDGKLEVKIRANVYGRTHKHPDFFRIHLQEGYFYVIYNGSPLRVNELSIEYKKIESRYIEQLNN